MGFVLVLVGVLFGTIRAQFLPQDGNVPQLLPLAPVQTSRLPQVEVDALLDIAAQLEPTAINTQTAVATWTNGTNPCNWIGMGIGGVVGVTYSLSVYITHHAPGVYCNCSATVYDPNLVACPPNSDGDHVYALDLSWRSNYRGNGWSPMQGTISPAVGALKELRYFAIRNNMYGGVVCGCSVWLHWGIVMLYMSYTHPPSYTNTHHHHTYTNTSPACIPQHTGYQVTCQMQHCSCWSN